MVPGNQTVTTENPTVFTTTMLSARYQGPDRYSRYFYIAFVQTTLKSTRFVNLTAEQSPSLSTSTVAITTSDRTPAFRLSVTD
ncbi:hypothetical protein RvY_11997 [Ramazzottius varieornatus]|uniref:Uncharacterized protein n=1 Tax=Ramazzottius varieornatus TaxID=947166 RepID=A0A1D1VNE2_RAMVA|nr:hypothetical protein RvY_11997 [Ramazzottius varieornatus]